jgi:hypothetical protein
MHGQVSEHARGTTLCHCISCYIIAVLKIGESYNKVLCDENKYPIIAELAIIFWQYLLVQLHLRESGVKLLWS